MKRCRVEADLVTELTVLSNRLNTLSPTWEHDEQQREEIQVRRQTLQTEIKHHRTKGHDGKRCPSFESHTGAFRR